MFYSSISDIYELLLIQLFKFYQYSIMAKKKSKRKKAKVIRMNTALKPEKYIKLHARKLPIFQTLISDSTFEEGIGHIVISRTKNNGEIIVGMYMVDFWCLGLKDTFFNILEADEYGTMIDQVSAELQLIEADPTYIFNLVYGAIEYAEDIGFNPHKDFSITEYILPNVESIEYMDIEFGYEGRPHYVAGPDDHIGKILSQLNKQLGEGNYEYTTNIEWDDEKSIDLEEWQKEVLDSPFYQVYTQIVNDIMDVYDDDFEKLKKDYLSDVDTMLDQLIKDLIEAKKFNEAPPSELISILRPAVENLVIHKNVNFLFESLNMMAFLEKIESLTNDLITISLFEFGDSKLESYCNIILTLEYEGEIKNAQQYLEKLIKDFDEEKEDLNFKATETELCLALIFSHIETFGPIDFTKIDITKYDA